MSVEERAASWHGQLLPQGVLPGFLNPTYLVKSIDSDLGSTSQILPHLSASIATIFLCAADFAPLNGPSSSLAGLHRQLCQEASCRVFAMPNSDPFIHLFQYSLILLETKCFKMPSCCTVFSVYSITSPRFSLWSTKQCFFRMAGGLFYQQSFIPGVNFASHINKYVTNIHILLKNFFMRFKCLHLIFLFKFVFGFYFNFFI